MHEVALISSALERAIAEARMVGATRIRQLTFTLAPDGHITSESLVTLFPIVAKGSMAEDAALQVDLGMDLQDAVP